MKFSEIYTKLKAISEEDILTHFPKRYDDLSLSGSLASFIDHQKVVLKGSVSKIVSIQGGKIIRLSVHGELYKEDIQCAIFNQQFYSRVIKKSGEYFFFGYYNDKMKTVMLSLVLSSDSLLVANRYKPYYNIPHDVSQSAFYGLVIDILNNHNDYINEILPSKYRHKYRLENRLQAFKDVHIPVSQETILRGLRVFKYEEALKYCLKSLQIRRQNSFIKKRQMTRIDEMKINSFVSGLSFRLTKDQLAAVVDIINDMNKPVIMNRLLSGDVGTGKTIVAFIALYGNALREGQGVIMAPTVTLARQHYVRAQAIFNKYGLNVVLLDNSLPAKEVKENIRKIKTGEAQIIIGTHYVFSSAVEYKNLTLAIIDEQHKFGVEQRDSLIDKGQGVDHLMMSATPIPQTLSRIINSDLDVSSLFEFPNSSREVTTKVIRSDDPLIDKAIKRAISIHKQVFVVAPKIEKNDKSSRLSAKAVYDDMSAKYGIDNVAMLNGKIKKVDQEKIYDDFVLGKRLVLVSTSLIEVGIDVKNACLMVIYEANYFGLASLHQLRGRIGRSGEGAMALLVYDGDDPDALDKLSYLSTHNKGEDVALYDLSNRGSGDMGGDKQSGQSELQVANFVKDLNIFTCAKEDAQEILENQTDAENVSYTEYILGKE